MALLTFSCTLQSFAAYKSDMLAALPNVAMELQRYADESLSAVPASRMGSFETRHPYQTDTYWLRYEGIAPPKASNTAVGALPPSDALDRTTLESWPGMPHNSSPPSSTSHGAREPRHSCAAAPWSTAGPRATRALPFCVHRRGSCTSGGCTRSRCRTRRPRCRQPWGGVINRFASLPGAG